MKKKYEMKVIRQCFLLKYYQFQLYMHEAYIYAESDRSSIAESDSSSSSDSDILEERVPKRAKMELEAAGPQNAENISPPLKDAATTQSPASPSPGNVAVCGQVWSILLSAILNASVQDAEFLVFILNKTFTRCPGATKK